MNPFTNKKHCLDLSGLKRVLICLVLASAMMTAARAQQVLVNLSPVDGIELSPENVFNYQIQSSMTKSMNAVIKGKLVYRANGLSFNYTFPYTVRPGVNMIDPSSIHPQWTFSSSAFKELFNDYKKLPAGTYEYCVEVSLQGPGGETVEGSSNRECLYHKSDEVFLINLVDPENNAKLHEYFPMFTWMVNYPFAAALTYNIRVAEVKDGQNNTAAINRNNPIYQEKNIPQTSIGYPVYAKPLEPFTPYAWTVDAYYKGILLGGAEPWRFTIIEDSVMNALPKVSYYVDIRNENANAVYYAVGTIKFKYILDELRSEALGVAFQDKNGKVIKIRETEFKAELGDNRYEIKLKEQLSLKHMGVYYLTVTNSNKQVYRLPIQYVNPDFVK